MPEVSSSDDDDDASASDDDTPIYDLDNEGGDENVELVGMEENQ